jgi:hypothetical protein
MNILLELLQFLRARRKLWMVPLILVMLMIGSVLLFAQGSVLAPLLYTLF